MPDSLQDVAVSITIGSSGADTENAIHAMTILTNTFFKGFKKKSVGGCSGEGPPDPISNSEVKLSSADGTTTETLWESRSLPTAFSLQKTPRWLRPSRRFLVLGEFPSKHGVLDSPGQRLYLRYPASQWPEPVTMTV